MTLRISKGGQVSLPARIRRRWEAGAVILEDQGDHVVLRPLPGDPVAAARGALRSRGHTAEHDRARLRREESSRSRA